MHRFSFKKNELYCEEAAVARIAKTVGTPFYLYSMGTFLDHFLKLKEAFKEINALICYSMKSNSNLTILKKLVSSGAGLDIVSGGELFRAKKVGVNPKKVVFASVGKSEEEITDAIQFGVGMFNVESVSELEMVNRIACKMDKIQDIAIRINPGVKAKTHRYITTGTKENKFGMDVGTAFKMFVEAYRFPFLRFSGIHLHIGSQITEPEPFIKAIQTALEFIKSLRISGAFIDTINIGGGLGIIYQNEKPQTADQFAKAILPLLRDVNLKVIIEPGRFISGNSGILVTKILHWKEGQNKTFAVVDAGMNDLMRPSLYDAYHEITPVTQKRTKAQVRHVDIVGPICESGDFLGKDRTLPKMEQGELLAVMSCGAYGFTMSSNYNSRPRAPEIVVKGRRWYVVKNRETYDDLIQGEKILYV